MNDHQVSRLVTVDDLDDARLSDYRSLRDVSLRTSLEAEHGLFIAEGEKVILRALEAGYEARSFLMARRWIPGLAGRIEASGAPCYVMSEEQIERVTGFHVHRGALASMRRPPPRAVSEVLADVSSTAARDDLAGHATVDCPEEPRSKLRTSGSPRSRIAVLEDLVDHANVGAAFRNAAALGVGAVLLSPRCADPLYRRAVKVSMGAVLQISWTRVENWPAGLGELREHGYVLAGMALAEDAITLDDLTAQDHSKLALVFGTEGHGLSARTDRLLDLRVTIPMMSGIDSLNVAASSAVAFYATR